MSLPYFSPTSRFAFGSFVLLLVLTILFYPAVAPFPAPGSQVQLALSLPIEPDCKSDKHESFSRYISGQLHQLRNWILASDVDCVQLLREHFWFKSPFYKAAAVDKPFSPAAMEFVVDNMYVELGFRGNIKDWLDRVFEALNYGNPQWKSDKVSLVEEFLEKANDPAALSDNPWEQKAIEYCARALQPTKFKFVQLISPEIGAASSATAAPLMSAQAEAPLALGTLAEPKCESEDQKHEVFMRYTVGQIFKRRDWILATDLDCVRMMWPNFWFKSPYYTTSSLAVTLHGTSAIHLADEFSGSHGKEMMKTDPAITPIVAFELMCYALNAKNQNWLRNAKPYVEKYFNAKIKTWLKKVFETSKPKNRNYESEMKSAIEDFVKIAKDPAAVTADLWEQKAIEYCARAFRPMAFEFVKLISPEESGPSSSESSAPLMSEIQSSIALHKAAEAETTTISLPHRVRQTMSNLFSKRKQNSSGREALLQAS